MLRIILSMLFTVAVTIGVTDLVPHGMWIQLLLLSLGSFGFGALLMEQLHRK